MYCVIFLLQFSYLAGNKKKSWKNFKQIMTMEKGLQWRADDPRCEYWCYYSVSSVVKSLATLIA